jgi:superfamily I DNA and/or RNA helicase
LKLLVVDEASMMPFPHFLALASLLFRESGEGRILLTGDHRQLAPVIQHQWEEEDRPGVQRYLPYLSAFEAMLRLREAMKAPQGVVAYSVLDYTHRLPQEVRLLIQPLYHRDGVELRGREAQKGMSLPENIWEAVWKGGEGVYLFVHGERESRKRNPLEAEVILRILQAAPQVDPQELAVVTPFRAQRTLLRERLGERVGLVDTVERLQGDERKVIFYSASASDPDAITSLQEFLLDVNRTNVAFSRAKEKLVVVVAETLLYYVPPEQEAYEDAVLWKELRRLCDLEVGEDRVGDYRVRLLVPRGAA